MKRLTSEDLFSLQYGDRVYHRKSSSYCDAFRYVGRMPSSERYLIFSEGEKLKHLYINQDGTFRGEWYSGDYDDKFIIQVRIVELEKELETLRKELHV